MDLFISFTIACICYEVNRGMVDELAGEADGITQNPTAHMLP
jgi:hypothetical protein